MALFDVCVRFGFVYVVHNTYLSNFLLLYLKLIVWHLSLLTKHLAVMAPRCV